MATVGVVAAFLLVLAFWGGRDPTPLSALAERSFQDSVAVLPFETHGGDPDLEELASRVSYEIVRRLSRSGVVKASHPFSVERLLALGLTAGQIADSLSVDRLISGTLDPSGGGPEDKLVLSIDVSDVRASTLEDTRWYEMDPSALQGAAVHLAELFVRDYLARYPDHDFLGDGGPSLQGPGYESYLVGVNSLGRRTPVELEPGGIDGMSWCAPTLGAQGEMDLGFRAAEQAIQMDPQNAGRRVSLSYIALALGDFARAGREARLAWQLEPELMLPRALEAWALLLSGDAEVCATRDLGPHRVVRATCLHEMGREQEAAAIVDSVRAALASGAFQDDPYTEVLRTGDLAVHYAWLGNNSESLLWLRRSYDLSPSGVESRVTASALFDPVRRVSGFEEEVQRIQSRRAVFLRARAPPPAVSHTGPMRVGHSSRMSGCFRRTSRDAAPCSASWPCGRG